MGRYGIALVACMIVLAGCAGPRVVSAGSDTIADLPAARGWAEDGYMLRTDLELGEAPAVDAVGEPAPAAADNEWPPCAPPPPPVPAASAAAADETAPVETAPAPEADVIEVTPADVPVEPVAESAPVLGDCCGKPNCGCKQRCCKKRSCGCHQCPCPDSCGNPCGGYVGGNLQFAPGLGAGIEFGINLKRTKSYLLSFEVGATYQDFYDELFDEDRQGVTGDNNLAGKMHSLRFGLRWRFKPCCTGHPTLRLGVQWAQLSGGPEFLDLAEVDSDGDYLGAYLGLGYEWDINPRWSTGPEVALFAGVDPDSGDTALIPTLYWHINYKF